jgi:hypothetical protein
VDNPICKFLTTKKKKAKHSKFNPTQPNPKPPYPQPLPAPHPLLPYSIRLLRNTLPLPIIAYNKLENKPRDTVDQKKLDGTTQP